MSQDVKSVQDDLAFVRSLIEETTPGFRTFGVIYMAAGLLYGAQCLVAAMQQSGMIDLSGIAQMISSVVPTVLFLIVCLISAWKDRANSFGTGVARRAVGAAFAGAGLANLVLAMVFGWIAWQKGDLNIWLFFPVVVCALQGAIWYAAAIIRRRLWMGIAAAGWFVSAAGLGLLLGYTSLYLWGLSAILFCLMAIPGYVMQRPETGAT